MNDGTPVKKLKGLDFFVFLYALREPRSYEDFEAKNNIGFGYVGEEKDSYSGFERIEEVVDWFRENKDNLRSKLGHNFPDLAQYAFFERFASDSELIVGNYLMPQEGIEGWIRVNLMRNLELE